MEEDLYRTIAENAESVLRERSSRFLSFAYPVTTEDEIKEIVDSLRRKYFDATHHCYAWRLGPDGSRFRQNDDGEPSGTAGKPILGQMVKEDITDCLVVVVRYFGGTKLGTAGLVQTYRQSAADVLDKARKIVRSVDSRINITFPYESINDVLKAVRDCEATVVQQQFDCTCYMAISIRLSMERKLRGMLEHIDGVTES